MVKPPQATWFWSIRGVETPDAHAHHSKLAARNRLAGMMSPVMVLAEVVLSLSITPMIFAQSTSSLTMWLGPVDILPMQARWRVDGGEWQLTGATVTGLSIGSHTVDCQPVEGWLTPSPRSLTLASGQALETRMSYRKLLLPDGVYFGTLMDWTSTTVQSMVDRLGRQPAVYVYFLAFPYNAGDIYTISNIIEQVNKHNGILMLTVEPFGGLSTVTNQAAEDFAKELAKHNRNGVQIFIRFAHEMNGAWYSWGQRPIEHRKAFQILAEAIHFNAPWCYMIWAPNYGDGYPYPDLQYLAKPGTSEFKELDTNHDGVLTAADDCYKPYYPGDDYVDWVGLSAYHWGNTYPWEENEVPEPGKFADMVCGQYNGANGNATTIPDFYGEYAVGHNKPMAIVETAAFYNTTRPNEATELAIKQTWWRQLFNDQTRSRFPKIMMVNWFEWRKHEETIGGDLIDWTLSYRPQILQAFFADISAFNWILFGENVQRPYTYTAIDDPAVKPPPVFDQVKPPATGGSQPEAPPSAGCAAGINGPLLTALSMGLVCLRLSQKRHQQ